jgi:outer membrane protein insertion porin family
MLRLLVIAALAVSLLPAQQSATRKKAPAKAAAPRTAAAPDRWPLAAIEITGNRVFPREAIVKVLDLQIGAPVNRTDFEAALARLQESGAFEALSFRYTPAGDKLAVTFEVQEVVDLYPVAFDRLEVPEAELRRHLARRLPLFGPQIPATGRMLERVVQEITSYLAARDQATDVVGGLAPDPDGKLVLTFRPAAGPPSITFVAFENSKVIRDVDLQAAFHQTAVGVPYTERRLNELLEHNIRPLFEEKGRLRVRFGPFRVEESQNPVGVQVTVPVEEGEEFQFGAVRFAGHAAVPARDLERLARLEEGAMANFALVHKAVADVERLYRRNGFMKARVEVERTVHDEKKSVDLRFRIEEGDQYKFRTLTIQGLDINAEAAVRRRWGLQRGQPYDASYAAIFVDRVHQDAMFEGLAKITPRETIEEAEKLVDIELTFHAAPPPKRPAFP